MGKRLIPAAEVAVVAMRDPRRVERARAFATPRSGATVTLDRIRARLGILAETPRAATGKFRKLVPRERARARAAPAAAAAA